MLRNSKSCLLIAILAVVLAIPSGCAKREREPKKVKKEQIRAFEQAMKEIKEAGVALNFSDLSNYTEEKKVLFNPEELKEPEKQRKVDTAVRLLWEVLNITNVSSNSLSLRNIMALNTQDSGSLTDEDLAYCYLELARLYVLRAAAIAISGADRFRANIDEEGGYDFDPQIGEDGLIGEEVQDFIDMLYILFGLKLKYQGVVINPSEDIKNTYLPFKHERTGSKGAVGLAFQLVEVAGRVLPADIIKALNKVKDYIEKFKDDIRSKEGEWGFTVPE